MPAVMEYDHAVRVTGKCTENIFHRCVFFLVDLDVSLIVMGLQGVKNAFALPRDHGQVVIFIISKCQNNNRFHGDIVIQTKRKNKYQRQCRGEPDSLPCFPSRFGGPVDESDTKMD